METLDKSLKDLKFGLIQLNDDIVPALRNELDEVRSTAVSINAALDQAASFASASAFFASIMS